MDNDLTRTYIGRKSCGCVVFAMVDEPNANQQSKRELAKEIASCIRQGLTIESVTVDYVRNMQTMGCKCDKPKQDKPQLKFKVQ